MEHSAITRRAAVLRQRAFPLVDCFTRFFTVSAAHRERHRQQPCFGDLASAFVTTNREASLLQTYRSM